MKTLNKSTTIVIQSVSWGSSPAPLLPSSLRSIWSSEPLPVWICNEIGLPADACISEIGPGVWKTVGAISLRLRHFLLFLLHTRQKVIAEIRCVDRTWPSGLKIRDVGWSARTRNRLESAGLLYDEQLLINLTFADLFNIRGMGAKGILDFCATLEGTIDFYEGLSSYYAARHVEDRSTNLFNDLKRISDEEWPGQISKRDPRFAPLIFNRDGTLKNHIDRLLANPRADHSSTDAALLINSITNIQGLITKLKMVPLENALMDFLASISEAEGNRLNALGARLGWKGYFPLSLDECGKLLGVTRERMRQIQDKVLDKIPDHEIFMPQIDEALSLLEKRTPLTLEEASTLLCESGITRIQFDLQSLLNASRLMGKQTTLQICETNIGNILVKDVNPELIRLVPMLARKLVRQAGVTSVFRVQEELKLNGYRIEIEYLRRVLYANSTLKFLDEDWFLATDIKEHRNRLHIVATKILSVASPQSIEDILDGVKRAYRTIMARASLFSSIPIPPLSVMRTFFERLEDFKVERDLVYSATPLDYTEVLSESDCILVNVLRSSAYGLLDRASFAKGCIAYGMKESTFNRYVTNNCILDHYKSRWWKLRGVTIDQNKADSIVISIASDEDRNMHKP